MDHETLTNKRRLKLHVLNVNAAHQICQVLEFLQMQGLGQDVSYLIRIANLVHLMRTLLNPQLNECYESKDECAFRSND